MCLPGIARPLAGQDVAGRDPQVKPKRLGARSRWGYALPEADPKRSS